ncbi:MAG: TraB/GumN family protein [Pseudomonadota bacterium]|nr:TraB/GumN family protein [Pseudomonadota bacterium]
MAIALFLLAVTPAFADPALWVAKHDSATIYLFGTVHALPITTKWHYPVLDRALASSDALYVELIDDDPATMQSLVMQYGIDFAHPLSSEIGAADEQRVEAAAQTADVPAQALDAMRPWLAALTLTVSPLLKAGFDPESGVDKVLRRDFAATGKPVHGLETAGEQIHFFADMSMPVEIAFLHSTLDDYAKALSEVDTLVRDWDSGDVDALARIQNSELRDKYPALYKLLLVDRNQRWAKQIAAMTAQHGTVFVAVGAEHLAGPDNVQAQLRKLGIDTTRLH